ncbi:MAG: hypothetical protein HC830_03900 [Bacteroidetes bacterium]|nr:hypothetical protein [Bacteroidota bacterium]
MYKPICPACNAAFHDLKPSFFNKTCPYCGGSSCENCNYTGMYPDASRTTWQGYSFKDILNLQLKEFHLLLIEGRDIPVSALDLKKEILNRCDALMKLGLGYISLNRPSPTLSRGEYQRVQLAMAIANRVNDVIYLLDEPTIGLHPSEVMDILPEFRKLNGTIIYIEHDKRVIINADECIEIGPKAGKDGGRVIYKGKPEHMPTLETVNQKFFKQAQNLKAAKAYLKPALTIYGAHTRNLKNIDILVPAGLITIITGVSGSGKVHLLRR